MKERVRKRKKEVIIVLYNDFTALDVFGPVEVLGNVEDYTIGYASLRGGLVHNRQGIAMMTQPMEDVKSSEIVLIPGGYGSRTVIQDKEFLAQLDRLMQLSQYVLCVCTGSALAAATGSLTGKRATSNKMAFEWVKSQGSDVCWDDTARWVRDGNLYTSSGVSAGIDMAVGFVWDQFGAEEARRICNLMEYNANDIEW